MTEAYKLAAKPFLFPEGEFQGNLKGVTFVVTSPSDTKQWFTINCGQFSGCFGKLMPLLPRQLVKEIVAALINGDEVEFPSLYQEPQFDRGFAYETSPVHFELPPSLVPAWTGQIG